MNLGELLWGVDVQTTLPESLLVQPVLGLDYDSRRLSAGFVFFAFPGAHVDGRKFVQDAAARGAIAVVSDLESPGSSLLPWVRVSHGREALSLAARNFYRECVERVALTGITGTNGKTTTCYLTDSILRAAGKTTAMIGTIEYHVGSRVVPAPNTTPESLDLYRLFAELTNCSGGPGSTPLGPYFATMEVSSHALELRRVYGMPFHTAVFTNLTQDHLDFHGSMERYFEAKLRLFRGAGGPPPKFAVINRDDVYGKRIRADSKTHVFSYGLGAEAEVRAEHFSTGFTGLHFDLTYGQLRFRIESPLIGRINIYNILAACSTAMSYQIPPDAIARGVADCKGVPGRFERVDEGQPFAVVVDYSHTDDALRNAIRVARGLHPKRVITLFGCGGDRDRAKRPLMGQAAAEGSDLVILTSDNPRSEEPLQIMNDILVGLRRKDTPYVSEPDRRAAIRRALSEARPGDFVLLAGKGHETYQILKDRTIDFDDRAVAREILRGFGYAKP